MEEGRTRWEGARAALNIEARETRRLARALAQREGITLTHVGRLALQEALRRRERSQYATVERLDAILGHFGSLPVLDDRPADEILGYDGRGLPT